MKVFINPGHCPKYDSGAVGYGLNECDVVLKIAIDALTKQIKDSNDEQKKKFENLEDEVKELKFKINRWEAMHNESIH